MKKFFAILAIATVTFASCNNAAEGDASADSITIETPAVVDTTPVVTDTMPTVDSTVVVDSAN